MVRHFRKHWKKYAFGSFVYILGGSYLVRKLRDRNVIREYCAEVKQYGEAKIEVHERPKKVTVFLNPMANKMDAKIQFKKYAAPLFNLSGYDVTIVESEYEGQIRTLMGYIDPDCDAIVVAGGDGTIMEVVNGLMRRWDVEKTRAIPIGILPLGRENRFYTRYFPSRVSLSQTRRICEAAMDVIHGATVPIHLMQLEPGSGKTLFALSSIHWGVFRDSSEVKDRFKLFGKFRLLISHIRTALKGWPGDHSLHLWTPASSALTPSEAVNHTTGTPSPSQLVNQSITGLSRVIGSSEPTPLSERAKGWQERQLDVVGFNLCLTESANLAERLKTVVWLNKLNKWDFVKQGWETSLGRPTAPLPGTISLHTPQLVLQPLSATPSWLSIDGESYEAMPLAVTVLPSVVRVFTRHS